MGAGGTGWLLHRGVHLIREVATSIYKEMTAAAGLPLASLLVGVGSPSADLDLLLGYKKRTNSFLPDICITEI